ncbi:MAG: restriction endonuclease subunit S [Oscillospiraceae bacterium]|nr:restriction endonuclease subunit S [Oscillospiraceae bacterium]
MSWDLVRLGDLCDIARGGSPRPILQYMTTSSDGINWIKIGDANPNAKYITSTKEKIKPEGVSASRRVYPGDFLLSNSMSFGRPYILKVDGCIHDGWLVLGNISDALDNDYLYYVLCSSYVKEQFAEAARGAIVNNLNIDIANETIIPLPPLDEQRRIATEIESKLAAVEKAKHAAMEQLAAAKALKSAYLREVFEGTDWEKVLLGDIGNVCMCKRIFKDQTYPSGDIPFYKIGTFGGKADAFISQDVYESYISQFPFPKKGDVLISAAGTLGRAVIYDGEPAYFQDSNIVWIDNDESKALNSYLYHFYATKPWTGIDGAIIARLYNDNIREAEISLPPIEEQHRIVENLEQSYAIVTKTITALQAQLETINAMPAAILRQAFSG